MTEPLGDPYGPVRCTCDASGHLCEADRAWSGKPVRSAPIPGRPPRRDWTQPHCARCLHPWDGATKTCDTCRTRRNAQAKLRRQQRRR